MVLIKLPQLPTIPSMTLNTRRQRSKASTTFADSITPSPTQSTYDISTSVERGTSVTDPEDYADNLAAKTVSSVNMNTKFNTTENSDQAADSAGRRASGRARKLTAKAVALNGSKSYSPPLSDTIVIGEPTAKRRRSSTKQQAASPTPSREEPNEVQAEIPETPTNVQANGFRTASPEDIAQNEAPSPTVETPASRRQSRRERKPTAKILLDTSTSQKRPASDDDAQDTPPRKSARISLSGARVPSKLRYSMSSEDTEDHRTVEAETEAANVDFPETPVAKKSLIVVLKYKRPTKVSGPAEQPKTKDSATPTKRRSRRTTQRQKSKPTKDAAAVPEPRPRPVEISASCDLFCLSPSSRLLAFAEIAIQVPDQEDENEEVQPGSVYDWRMYTHSLCQCNKGQQLKTDRTNSAELARALMPNTLSQGTKADPVDPSTSQTPEAELLSTPINSILRASDAERLSQLYTVPGGQSANQTPNSTPATGNKRRADYATTPNGQPPAKRVAISESPNGYSLPLPQPSHSARRTYEDRLRDDYHALADVRKRAAAQGIPWSFNMTFDDIHNLILDADDREQQTRYRQQTVNPPQAVLARVNESNETRPSPTGFGVLLPPKGTTYIQRTSSVQPQRKDSFLAVASTNGTTEATAAHPGPSNISFIEETNPANPSKNRRPSSPSRPKSSRFRVDPRGLRGESPGPGTIINMKEKAGEAKKKPTKYPTWGSREDFMERARGLARIGKAQRDMEAKRGGSLFGQR